MALDAVYGAGLNEFPPRPGTLTSSPRSQSSARSAGSASRQVRALHRRFHHPPGRRCPDRAGRRMGRRRAPLLQCRVDEAAHDAGALGPPRSRSWRPSRSTDQVTNDADQFPPLDGMLTPPQGHATARSSRHRSARRAKLPLRGGPARSGRRGKSQPTPYACRSRPVASSWGGRPTSRGFSNWGSAWLPPSIEVDAKGFVLTDCDIAMPAGVSRQPFALETSHPGVFAAGDVRHGSVKRSGPREHRAVTVAGGHAAILKGRGGRRDDILDVPPFR